METGKISIGIFVESELFFFCLNTGVVANLYEEHQGKMKNSL